MIALRTNMSTQLTFLDTPIPFPYFHFVRILSVLVFVAIGLASFYDWRYVEPKGMARTGDKQESPVGALGRLLGISGLNCSNLPNLQRIPTAVSFIYAS